MPEWLKYLLFFAMCGVVLFGVLGGLWMSLTEKPDHDRDHNRKWISSMTDSDPFN